MAFLRILPHFSVAMPRDVLELRSMLKKALLIGGPVAVRWPRGGTERAPDLPVDAWLDLEWGSWEVLKEGEDAYLLCIGPTVEYGLEAVQGNPRVGVVNARFVKPLDESLLLSLASRAKVLITAEDHAVAGGLGSAVAEVLQDAASPVRLIRLGVPNMTVPHGDVKAQHEDFGFGPRALRDRIEELGLGVAPTAQEADRATQPVH